MHQTDTQYVVPVHLHIKAIAKKKSLGSTLDKDKDSRSLQV